MDFTLTTYTKLLLTFIEANYIFYRLEDFFVRQKETQAPMKKFIILRHDVDRRPKNALETAKIEHDFGIEASYYFRIVKKSFDENIIKKISGWGHEIGYHYEDLALARGNRAEAIRMFADHLKKLREFYPVKTICMHGSPLSRWDNRLTWEKFNYKDFDIIGEPYFDIDFSKVFYLTDTGRRWDNRQMNVRDKMDETAAFFDYRYKTTGDIIAAVANGIFPTGVIINSHPERWTNKPFPWVKQWVWQNTKNIAKRFIAR